MYTFRLFSMAALALMMAACSEDDNTTGQPTETRGIPFTATLSNGGSTTRVLTGPHGSDVITATWALHEHVALVYKVGDETKVTDAEVTAVSDGTDGKKEGTATITATLDENVTTGTDVTLIYPYSAVNTSGENIGRVKEDMFQNQAGTIDYISSNCDLRQGEGKITLSTGSATLKNNVTMASQIAIWIIDPKDASGNALDVKKLDVYFGGMTASTPEVNSGRSEFYMAVPAGSTGVTILAVIDGARYIYNKASVTLNASTWYNSEVKMTKLTTRTITTSDGEVTLNDGDIVTGTGGAGTQLKIADGATVTLAGVTNKDFTTGYMTGIECLGDATIILAYDTKNTFRGHWQRAAVYIPVNCTLTIRGSGKLIADNTNNNASGAGIGGSFSQDCGNIVIEGGKITANSDKGAGIGGGGNNHGCGNITILGGTINATGGVYAAGIGSGGAEGAPAICEDIIILGGTVNATGGIYAAGIGCGYALQENNSCGHITISGSAKVDAKGGIDAAGIGSGKGNVDEGNTYVSSCGVITISGGTVKATAGGDFAAGIGGGNYGEYISISITSGITSVIATSSGESYAPIGKGSTFCGTDGKVTIDGTTIDGGFNYCPHEWDPSSLTPPNTTANGNLNWTLSGNTWTLTH